MRERKVWAALAALCLACGGDGVGREQASGGEDGGRSGDDRDELDGGDGGLDGAQQEPTRPEFERGQAVRDTGGGAEGLTAASEVLAVFVKQDPTLALDADACANAENVAARVREVVDAEPTTGCAQLSAACEDGVGSVSVTFAACPLEDTGSVLSGTVVATVSTATAETTTVTVTLELTDVTLESDQSYELEGTLSTSTSDLSAYTLLADLTVSGYSISFDGVLAAAESDTGVLEGVTLTGTGSLQGPTMEEALGSWQCSGSGFSYELADFHRSIGACRADAGVITIDQSYTCATTVTVKGKPKTVMSSATVRDLVTFDEQTPTTGTVHVVTTTTIAEQTTTSEQDVALTGECES